MRKVSVFILGAAAASAGFADVATITSSKDNTIFNESASRSNGAGEYLFAGSTARGEVRRGLVAFDVAGSIPAGSLITGVTLTLHQSRTIASSESIALHRLTSDWGEGDSDAPGEEGGGAPATPGDATWSHAVWPSTPWASSGGDFVAAASATALIAPAIAFYDFSSPGMIADVQGWLDSGDNFGWMLRGDEASAVTAMRFDTHENANPATWPALEIEYIVPEPTGLGLLLLVGALRAARFRRA